MKLTATPSWANFDDFTITTLEGDPITTGTATGAHMLIRHDNPDAGITTLEVGHFDQHLWEQGIDRALKLAGWKRVTPIGEDGTFDANRPCPSCGHVHQDFTGWVTPPEDTTRCWHWMHLDDAMCMCDREQAATV